MRYFTMVCEGKPPIMPIARVPRVSGQWRIGRPIADAIPQPLVYSLDADYPGTPKAMYYEKSIPLLRDDVKLVFDRLGIDNIQYFDAVLRNPKTSEELTNYKAFNIVGLVACADMRASEVIGSSATAIIGDIDFHSLVIDETKTQGLVLFRLAEATNAIVVHENVRQALQSAGIPGFVFYGPGEWSG